MNIPTELQGEGTYNYDCRKQECFHCFMMGLKPLPQIPVYYQGEQVKQDPPQLIGPTVIRFTSKHWTRQEESILYKHAYQDIDNLVSLLPGRSRNSILIKLSQFRKLGKLGHLSRKRFSRNNNYAYL